MAIDPEKYGEFRDSDLTEFVESVPGIGNQAQEIIEDHIDPLLDEYDDLLRGERKPRLYIFGQAGAGKSSLINALANKDVASVGASEPETAESTLYPISFPERYSNWEVVDSRGLFESMPPDGAMPVDTVEFVKEDIREHRPDVLLHLTTPDQKRAGKNNLEAISHLQKELENMPPVLTVLNKVDSHISPGGDWPPENNSELSGHIRRDLEYISETISDVILEDDFETTPIDQANPVKGLQFNSEKFIGVIPVFAKDNPYWNIDTLSMLIGDHLPDDARLQFFQAQERASIMRNIAKDVTYQSSKAAAAIGAAPTSYADIIPITALQYVEVALIGALSCRELEFKTVAEFISSAGLISGAAVALRKAARGLIQFIPVGGQVISGGVAASGTYAMGRTAESYFFDDIVEEPDTYMDEGEELAESLDLGSE